MSEQKYVVFCLGEGYYSMNIEYVSAIEQQYSIIPLPEAPENVKGMINLRGEIIPVYSLRSRFHMAEIGRTSTSQLLIVRTGAIQLAFEVDAVVGIETVDVQQKKEIPVIIRGNSTNYIGGILNIKDDIIVEISVENIVTESEWEAIEETIRQNV
jgi:purine-binding chemotaxis protein CheW